MHGAVLQKCYLFVLNAYASLVETKYYIKFNDQRCIPICSAHKPKEGEAAPCTQVRVRSNPGRGTGSTLWSAVAPRLLASRAARRPRHQSASSAALRVPRQACSAQQVRRQQAARALPCPARPLRLKHLPRVCLPGTLSRASLRAPVHALLDACPAASASHAA